MAHWAKVGARCVCISENAMWRGLPVVSPRKGKIYTIREVVDGGGSLLLHEISNSATWYIEDVDRIGEPCFGVWRFRPLITRTQEQDVELFAPLLDTANHRDLERAQ